MNHNPRYNPNRYIIYRHSYEIIYDTNYMNYLNYSPRVIYHPVQTFFRSNLYPETTYSENETYYPEISYLSGLPNIPSIPNNPSYPRTENRNNNLAHNRFSSTTTDRYPEQNWRRSETIRPPPGFEQLLDSNFFQALYPLINTSFEDVPVIISEQQFESLETITSQNIEEDSNCTICQDRLRSQPSVKILPCHHMFHIDCAKQWLCRTSCKCPICRYDVRESLNP